MRLPNGYGSVYKLSGKRRKPFAVRRTAGWKDNGQPIYEWIGYYATKREALAALAKYNEDPYDLQDLTFAQCYERWSEQDLKTMSDKRQQMFRRIFRECEMLHDMPMRDIKLAHLQAVIDQSGKNLPTLQKMKQLFTKVFDYAIMHEIIAPDRKELIGYIDLSKAPDDHPGEHRVFTQSEIRRLWKHSTDENVQIVLILIYTGVRISELLDLKKEDVHMDEKWFYVRKAKTKAGIRAVPIADKILPIMDRWMKNPSDCLICNMRGRKASYETTMKNRWAPAMELLGMDHTPHDTRHTCITLLTQAGVDERILKQIVGHAGGNVTEVVYTHISMAPKLEAINKI